jgi:hypothetical protein
MRVSEKIIYLGQFGEKIEAGEDKYLKEAEMFSTGTHRGVEYTEDDIKTLVDNFSTEDEIPVQLDHSESARDTVGFLREVFSDGGKLKGKLEILDEEIQKKVDKGLMKKLSVSFYLKHTEEGIKPHKLREVSLVAFPQVKGARLFSENGYVSDYEEKGGEDMTQENKIDLNELKAQLKQELETEIHEQYSELQKQVESLQGADVKLKQATVESKIEKFSADNKIVPAQKDALSKLMASFSDEQTQLFEDFMSNSSKVDFSEQGEFNEQDGNEEEKDERTQEEKDFDKFYEEHAAKYGTKL